MNASGMEPKSVFLFHINYEVLKKKSVIVRGGSVYIDSLSLDLYNQKLCGKIALSLSMCAWAARILLRGVNANCTV